MGIDLHNLHFLAHAQDLGVRFDRSLAIGRQALFVEDRAMDAFRERRRLPALREAPRPAGAPRYFEPLMQQWFGAAEAHSVDASAYENATLIHDMNAPWPQGSPGRGHYDAVIDFGCLEHVFDFPTAWRNCVDLCRVGGHVLHALPANNLCGHGFYQFSPELFFNLYQPQRGFEVRALMFAMKAEPRYWWKVSSPMEVKRRVNLRNSHEVYVLVLVQKLREPGALPPPQQSDYAQAEWVGQGTATNAMPAPNALQRPLASLGLLDLARRARESLRAWRASGLSLPAPDYERVHVDTVIAR